MLLLFKNVLERVVPGTATKFWLFSEFLGFEKPIWWRFALALPKGLACLRALNAQRYQKVLPVSLFSFG